MQNILPAQEEYHYYSIYCIRMYSNQLWINLNRRLQANYRSGVFKEKDNDINKDIIKSSAMFKPIPFKRSYDVFCEFILI